MMQAADLWDLDHLAKRGRLERSADRRILFERQMRTAPSVVCKILLQGLAQPSLTEDKDVVQTLPSNGSDQALRVGVLPWIAAQSGLPEYPNISPLLSINAVPIAQQIARGIVPRECFQKLTGCPFCCGVRGHSEMNRTSGSRSTIAKAGPTGHGQKG